MLNIFVNFGFSIMKKTTKFSPRKINIDLAIYVLKSADYYAHDCILKMKLVFHEPSLFFLYICTIQSWSFF